MRKVVVDVRTEFSYFAYDVFELIYKGKVYT